MSHAPSPDVADLQRVLDEELKYIHHHRHSDIENSDVVRRSLIGLAMSGGGIRSATTSLGILQALARMRILPMVDFVSTVSGGGYIGACLSSLLSWNQNAPPTPRDPAAAYTFGAGEMPAFSTNPENFPFRADHSAHRQDVPPHGPRPAQPRPQHPRAGNGIVAHLRTHGNFLIAHHGLFRREALRGVGALTLGGVYNGTAFLLTLLTASAVYLAMILAMAPALPKTLAKPQTVAAAPDTIHHSLVSADSSIVRTSQGMETCDPRVSTCATETATKLRPTGIRDGIARNARAVAIVFATALPQRAPAGESLLAIVPLPLRPIVLALLLGVLSVVGILIWISIALRRYVRGRSTTGSLSPGDSVEDRFERRVLRRSAWALLLATGAAVIAGQILWRRSVSFNEQVVWLFVPLAVLTGAWVTSFISNAIILPMRRKWTRRTRSLTSAFYAIASWGWWVMLAVGIAPLAIYAMRDHPLSLGVGAVGSLIASRLLAGRTSGSKRFSLPPGALRILLGLVVLLVITLGGLFFATLLAKRFETWQSTGAIAAIGVLVFIALGWRVNHNRLGPQYFYRDRLSETYLFSELPDEDGRLRVFRDAMEMPLNCLHGQSKAADWRNTAPYHLIGAAINLSGSRDLTRKDRKSGYWLFSKLFCGSMQTGFRETSKYRGGLTKLANAIAISGAAASSGIGKDTFFAQAFATVLFNIRLGSWLENPAHESSVKSNENNVFWPWYLVREALMNTKETKRLVNLSDGGHTGDNLGIYPLLQRRCKVIIACDAERDPRLTFGSFTEALRHAYIDMGIDVDIDLTMIRADPQTGLSRTHCAVGRIHYPDRPDQESTLIYMKNSLMGSEPEPVLNYKMKCPDFPHETTADQFFDDAQFESYRALGVHVAEHTFGRWAQGLEFDTARAHHTPSAA
ncbi:MAG: patatin-like phospholipase family protein [Gemmatimonadaceae bacterium]|nr:patatin-like phospholipase family protein [Gemmatimonadaceae bacterium]